MAENSDTPSPSKYPQAWPAEGSLPEATRPRNWKQAKLAWILPLTGVLMLVAAVTTQEVLDLTRNQWRVILLIFWCCLIGGLFYTVLDFVYTCKYPNALPNALGGCAFYVILALLMLGFGILMLLALSFGGP
jgi:hypothetical protein